MAMKSTWLASLGCCSHMCQVSAVDTGLRVALRTRSRAAMTSASGRSSLSSTSLPTINRVTLACSRAWRSRPRISRSFLSRSLPSHAPAITSSPWGKARAGTSGPSVEL